MKLKLSVVFVLLCLLSCNLSGETYQLTDLGTMLGKNSASYAQGINSKGQVVGYWVTPTGNRAFLYESGKVTDLGPLGGANNYALSINDVGQVVGFSETKRCKDSASREPRPDHPVSPIRAGVTKLRANQPTVAYGRLSPQCAGGGKPDRNHRDTFAWAETNQ